MTAQFPDSTPSFTNLGTQVNKVSDTLDSSITSVAVSLTLADSSSFPSVGFVVIDNEAIQFGANNTGTGILSSLTRGADDTTNAVHDAGITVYANVVAAHHNRNAEEIIALGSDAIQVRKNIPNILVNGGMDIDQRGGPHTTLTEVWTLDRWQKVIGAAVWTKFDVSQETTAANVHSGDNSMKFDGTRTSGTVSLLQPIENFKDYLSKTVTFSAWVKTSTASAVRLRIVSDASSIQSSYHTGGGDWEQLSASVTLDSAPTNLNVYFDFDLTSIAYLDDAMLNIGSVAYDFVPENRATDLNNAQRFYELVKTQAGAIGGGDGANYFFDIPVFYRTTKSTFPTVTFSTITLIREEGSAVDQQGSYTKTAASSTIESVCLNLAKAVAGNKPNRAIITITSEV